MTKGTRIPLMPYKKGGALYGRLCAEMERVCSPIPSIS